MHGDEIEYVKTAYETNWMSTVGENINEVERIAALQAGMQYAVALSCCTAALHLAVKHAGEALYGKPPIGHGALEGKRVFCSDMTFDETLNPVVYEGGIPIFIDTEADSWNMDPAALETAFARYPDVKPVVSAITIDEDAMCRQERGAATVTYVKEAGKTCPTEILETLAAHNAEGRPIWKPMHMQPIYENHTFVSRGKTDVGADIFARGLCLPSDNKMTETEQNAIIEIVKSCFR